MVNNGNIDETATYWSDDIQSYEILYPTFIVISLQFERKYMLQQRTTTNYALFTSDWVTFEL